MRRAATLIALVFVAGCGGGGGDDKQTAQDQPRTETTRVEVIQSSGDGGFESEYLIQPGSLTANGAPVTKLERFVIDAGFYVPEAHRADDMAIAVAGE